MIRKALVDRVFEGFSIVRWNDHIRPIEFIEMDKHAHKMAVAYCLGKCEEAEGNKVRWGEIAKGGVFELLRRIVLSDIKAPVYDRIRGKRGRFEKLCELVYRELKPLLLDLPSNNNRSLLCDLNTYLRDEKLYLEGKKYPGRLSRRILDAAHSYASYREYELIRRVHPEGAKTKKISHALWGALEKHRDLVGISELLEGNLHLNRFIDVVGELRCQIRWSGTPRMPHTSVLGHSMMVAVLSVLFSLDLNPCSRRLCNNFFGGLFHDLPEALTRDIIAPVKKSFPEFARVLQRIEKEGLRKEIKPLLGKWWGEFSGFTRKEFESKYWSKKKKGWKLSSTKKINKRYNKNRFNPYDGEIVKIADDLAAYVEAYKAIRLGFETPQLLEGYNRLRLDYTDPEKPKRIGGVDFGRIFADFTL